MKYIAKLTNNFSSKENKLIQISNKFLSNSDNLQKGIELLSQKTKVNFSDIIKNNHSNYDLIRKKLINAKNAVLGFDLILIGGAGFIGFYNNWRTKKKTNQEGFSAEFNMANKEVVQKRAESYKKSEKYRKVAFISSLALLPLIPIGLRKGLNSNSTSKFTNFIKKYASKFDYNDGIFVNRLPFFLAAIAANIGIIGASRNQTEMKDNSTRIGLAMTAFFGGDILIGSILGQLSDKILKTNIINKSCEKNIVNKLIPPTRPLSELSGKSKIIGAALFWINLALLSTFIGLVIPKLLNKMIKHDVEKDKIHQK